MAGILSLYTSAYQEPRNGLHSLGGAPFHKLVNTDIENNVFSNLSPYESTNVGEDYRIIYAVNTSPTPVGISVILLSVEYLLNDQEAKASQRYLMNCRINLFIPPYADINYTHPTITTDGTVKSEFNNFNPTKMQDVINTNKGINNYGPYILLDKPLAQGEYFPIVLQRRITGPINYIKNFKVNLSSSYTIG